MRDGRLGKGRGERGKASERGTESRGMEDK